MNPKIKVSKSSGSVVKKARQTIELFIHTERMKLFVDVVGKMAQNMSVSAAINAISGSKKANRKVFDQCKRDLEKHLDIDLFKKGPGNSLIYPDDCHRKQLLEEICGKLRGIEVISNSLINTRADTFKPSVSIGTIPSVCGYLMPALLQAAKNDLDDECPDIKLVSCDGIQILEGLVNRTIDFGVFYSGLLNAKQKNVVEIRLPYCRSPQGALFVFETTNGERPFGDLSTFLEAAKITGLELCKLISGSSVVLMHPSQDVLQDSFENKMSEYFDRSNPDNELRNCGLRIFAPTYRHERMFIHHKVGIGFSHPPKNIDTRISNNGIEISYGTDPGFEQNRLAFVDSSIFEGIVSDFQPPSKLRFSIYVNENFRSRAFEGGLSEDADNLLNLVKEICSGKQGDFGYLQFGHFGSTKLLCHDYVYDGRIL